MPIQNKEVLGPLSKLSASLHGSRDFLFWHYPRKRTFYFFYSSSLVVTRTSVKKETVYSHVTVSWPPSLLSRLQIPRTSNYLQTPQKRPRGPSKYDYIARLIFWTIQLRLFNTMEKYIYSLRPSLKEIPIKKQDQDLPPNSAYTAFRNRSVTNPIQKLQEEYHSRKRWQQCPSRPSHRPTQSQKTSNLSPPKSSPPHCAR